MLFDTHAPAVTVKVNGAPLPMLVADCLGRIVIEVQRNLPAMCEVGFSDDDATVADNPMLRPGASLKIESPPASTDPTATSLGPLFDGEIVAIEADLRPDGGRLLVVRAYDKSHRLHRSRKTRTFLMQPDNAVATQIAGEVGLIPRTDPTGGPHEYLCQHNQTDWEFLSERARENGFELQVSNGALSFRKAGPDPLAGVPQTLTHGEDLLSFRARATSAEQPRTTKVKAWNPTLKQSVLGMAVPPVAESTANDPLLAPMTVAARFGSSEDVRTDLPLDLPPNAIKHATARRNHAATLALEAEGRCVGNPAMRPGGKIKIEGVGRSFSGSYTLSSVRHVFDSSGYLTSFTVSGLHDRSLLGLTRPGAATGADERRDSTQFNAPVVAKVSNTNDPQVMGRVKVEMPWLGDQAESHWAQVVSVGGGSGKGLQVIPEVGDSVLVVFEHADARRPFVLGGLYNAIDMMPSGKVPPPVAGGKTNIRVFKTRAGHEVSFDDTAGKEAITITSAGGAKIAIVDKPGESITLSDKSGKNKITIDGTAQKVVLESAANLELKATGNLALTANGQVKIEGKAGVELKTPAMMKIEGTGGLTAKSAGPTSVEGSITAVKATGVMNLQGTLVKIN